MRRHNLCTLVRHLHLAGALSRSSLTMSMGLNRSTIADLVGEVELLGLARQQLPEPRGHSAAGRPSVGVTTTDHAYVLAVDIRVSGLTVARVGLGGVVLATAGRPSPPGHDPRDTVDAIGDLARAVVRAAPEDSALVGVGVSVPGIVARDGGIIRLAPNLEWHDLALAQMLADALGTSTPPVLGNEADHGALAELLRGAGRRVSDLVYLSGEVGVGAGLIAGGRPVTGMSGFAGEIGHLPFGDGTRPCHCGAVGCWETEIGAAAIADAVGCPPDRLADVGGHLQRLDGPPTQLASVGRQLGRGLAGLVNLLNPQLIVLGGYLGPLYRWVETDVRAEMAARSLRIPEMTPRIAMPGLADRSVLIGASEVAFRALLDDPVGCLAAAPRTGDLFGVAQRPAVT
ncbi:ROK family protein [Mycolicibacterium litorale]|nr:ROK family protein [Mycolicibacterium litorale]MCV7414860.1 ROK family protein [Mycolicibacterium litorale]TDY08107.1 putative NBD/HSP70 family sugar kinase [Mycolicibacterium litorale]